MILTVSISGYRSLRELIVPLDQLTIVTGANGSGKSSFYRALRLLTDVAQGRAISSIALEGGLESVLWAGPESITRAMKSGEHEIQGGPRKGPVSLKLGFCDEDFGYAVDLGLPIPGSSLFDQDPVIKAEALWIGEVLRHSNWIAKRAGPAVQVLQEGGKRETVLHDLSSFDSMMTHAAGAQGAYELLSLRERMRLWRFYDHLRTDQQAPAREVRIGTRTPSLAPDGGDLAAAIQTIFEIGDKDGFDEAVASAFDRGRIEVIKNHGMLEVLMHQHGMLRPLRTRELSDGTLRYIMLAAALFTPRPPPLLVLNEPETSLHASLIEPLADMIANAAQSAQIVLVTHNSELIGKLEHRQKTIAHHLSKEFGETIINGLEYQRWEWPSR